MKKKTKQAQGTTTTLIPYSCAQCGIEFAVQKSFEECIINRGVHFYCPSGHSLEHVKYADERRAKLKAEREAREAKEKELEKQVVKTFWDKVLPWR